MQEGIVILPSTQSSSKTANEETKLANTNMLIEICIAYIICHVGYTDLQGMADIMKQCEERQELVYMFTMSHDRRSSTVSVNY